jgi:hypothetical protein
MEVTVMKHLSLTSRACLTIISGVTAGVIIVTGGLLVSVPAAHAAGISAEPSLSLQIDQHDEERQTRRLQHLFNQQKLMLAIQEDHLVMAREAAADAQERIDELKAEGKDTARIEAALAAFNGGIEAAQSSWNTARSILSAGAGFDDKGQVIDQEQARETVRSAGRALQDTGRILRRAAADFRHAARQFRQAQ